MATAYTADNYSQISFMGAYGNKSIVHGYVTMGTYSQYDTVDLVKIPAGAVVYDGFLLVATAVTTATVSIGVRYADGTSTGGTTGTAVMSGTGSIVLTTALANQPMTFEPFTNDADTIVYAIVQSPGFTPGANTKLHALVGYKSDGTK